MILASLERLRAIPRLAEITRTLIHFGLHDLVHSAGLHRVLEEAGHGLGWSADPALAARPIAERGRMALDALARRVEEQDFAVQLEVRQLDRFSRHLETSVNRLAIGLVTAALIVGSAILISVVSQRQSLGGWFFASCGVAIAFVNSLWLIASIRRSRH